MRLFNEDQILDPEYRKQIIDEILGSENVARKQEARKRYEVYRDKTIKHVIERLEKQGLEPETVESMKNRASNISICRKIVNKLARAYLGGVTRTTGDDLADTQVVDLAKLLSFNQKQKKSDRYRELYKNCAIQFVPELDQVASDSAGRDLHNIKQRVFSPWQYDVIEDSHDREKARVYILSDYAHVRSDGYTGNIVGSEGIHGMSSPTMTDIKDVNIADAPQDAGLGLQQEFIWWSGKYHFTTDIRGDIVSKKSPDDNLNPIQMLNFVTISEDQDNQYWAEGGDDLVDGSILVNVIITDMFAIAYQQGWGQFVVIGKNISANQKVGPHNAMVFNVEDKDDPMPSVNVISANPPLDMWMKSIEQYVALLLSTNDLSPATVAMKLDAVQFPSGISMLIEMSEARNEINNTQEMYVDAETLEWKIIGAWQNKYMSINALTEDFKNIGSVPENLKVTTKFNERKPVITEKEKLDNIRIRNELGINERIDLIMLDNPDFSKKDAEEKLKSILKEEIESMANAIETAVDKDKKDDNQGE